MDTNGPDGQNGRDFLWTGWTCLEKTQAFSDSSGRMQTPCLHRHMVSMMQQKQYQHNTSFPAKAIMLPKMKLVLSQKSCSCPLSMQFCGQGIIKTPKYGTRTSIIGTRKSEIETGHQMVTTGILTPEPEPVGKIHFSADTHKQLSCQALSRMTSSGCNMLFCPASSKVIIFTNNSMPRRPSSQNGCRMVVRAGQQCRQTGRSS